VKTYIYGQNLVNLSVLEIMQAHRVVRQVQENELSEFETFPVIEALSKLNLGIAHIDAGRIAVQYEEGPRQEGISIDDYVRSQVEDLIGTSNEPVPEPRDVVLYGFGRIGRLMARLLVEKAGGGETLRLRAIVVRQGGAPNDLVKRASLLRRDSVHGPFKGTIRVDEENNSFVANGNEIKVIYASQPEEVDYTEYGINDAIVIDNTGIFKDEEGLSRHLRPGASKVILTAPGSDVPNIVYGVNDDLISDGTVISAASCTTNAIVPPLKAMNDEFGIVSGHVETIHAYTNDQNLIDNYHKAERRGRSAPLNMVITSTGAAKAVAKVLPVLKGKLTGNAIRVPTPNVSMAILSLTLEKETSVEEVNQFMRTMAIHSPLRKQIDYSNSPEVVSSDLVGSRHACVFDSEATVVNGKQVILYCWYDNEFGYSCQVHRVLEKMANVEYRVYPRES
jgi:glyceraldehyde 3-phosphate dehydrogenase